MPRLRLSCIADNTRCESPARHAFALRLTALPGAAVFLLIGSASRWGFATGQSASSAEVSDARRTWPGQSRSMPDANRVISSGIVALSSSDQMPRGKRKSSPAAATACRAAGAGVKAAIGVAARVKAEPARHGPFRVDAALRDDDERTFVTDGRPIAAARYKSSAARARQAPHAPHGSRRCLEALQIAGMASAVAG